MTRKKGNVTVTFWGTRGSIPTPQPSHLKSGGNTSCVTLREGRHQIILDGGTGIRNLGLALARKNGQHHLLISHNHMDHLCGIPFFAPALKKGCSLKIYGPANLKESLNRLFPFPVLPARKKIEKIQRPKKIDSFYVIPKRLNHPGYTLGYSLVTPSRKKIVYMSDHEPFSLFRHHPDGSDEKMVQWMKGADLLILDSQYRTKEYRTKKGWGHSPVSQTVKLALKAEVKKLMLFHHDPSHSDKILRKKLQEAKRAIRRAGARLVCRLAKENDRVRIV